MNDELIAAASEYGFDELVEIVRDSGRFDDPESVAAYLLSQVPTE